MLPNVLFILPLLPSLVKTSVSQTPAAEGGWWWRGVRCGEGKRRFALVEVYKPPRESPCKGRCVYTSMCDTRWLEWTRRRGIVRGSYTLKKKKKIWVQELLE